MEKCLNVQCAVRIGPDPERCGNADCPTAIMIMETRKKNNRLRRERNQALRDLGLTRVKGMLGGVYWE